MIYGIIQFYIWLIYNWKRTKISTFLWRWISPRYDHFVYLSLSGKPQIHVKHHSFHTNRVILRFCQQVDPKEMFISKEILPWNLRPMLPTKITTTLVDKASWISGNSNRQTKPLIVCINSVSTCIKIIPHGSMM